MKIKLEKLKGIYLMWGILFGCLFAVPLNTLLVKFTTIATWLTALESAAALSAIVFSALTFISVIYTFLISGLINPTHKVTSEERKLTVAFLIGIVIFTFGRLAVFAL